MPSPHEALIRAIDRWEGLFQAQPQDVGNYVAMPDGSRRLVGTMRGVTPAVLAAHRGIAPGEVMVEMMKSVTLAEAAEIGLTRFYKGTGLDRLPWGPATEALVDFGWGSGPGQAVRSMQRLCGASADGIVGPHTIEAYAAWVARIGWPQATRDVAAMRRAFYDLIIAKHPAWEIYRKGWYNRANWMTPESADWWAPWAAAPARPPVVVTAPTVPTKPQAPPPVAPPRDTSADSGTIGAANTGKIIAAGTAAASAGAPILQGFFNADWKVAAIFGVVILVLAGLGFLAFRRIGRRRAAEIQHALGG